MAQSCQWQVISSWPGMGLQDLQSMILEHYHQIKYLLAQHDSKGIWISTTEALKPKFTKEHNIAIRLQPLTIAFFQGFLFHLKGNKRATQIICPTLSLQIRFPIREPILCRTNARMLQAFKWPLVLILR